MALSRRFDPKRAEKMRPKSCEIMREKCDWKSSFQDRKSVFEQPFCEPLNNKSISSARLLTESPSTVSTRLTKSPSTRLKENKEVDFSFFILQKYFLD